MTATGSNTITITVAVTGGPVDMAVMMDNHQLGNQHVTVDYASGAVQTITITGNWPTTAAHEIGCKHNTDGSTLHVLSASLDGIAGVCSNMTPMTKVDWRKFEVPVKAAVVVPPVVVPAKPVVRDVLIGGFGGFTAMTEADLVGLRETGRGGIYVHMSIANAANAAAVHSVLSILVPEESNDGHTVAIEWGTNTAPKKGDAFDSFVAIPGLVVGSGILNCGSSGDLATSTALLNSNKAWITSDIYSRWPGTTIAPVVTPGGNDAYLGTDYGTHPHWANQRALEQFGGRACDDIPAAYYNQTGWFKHNVEHGAWALANGLPYDVILSPTAGSNFTADVQTVCKLFWAAGVFPTRFIVESYTPGIGCTIGLESADTLNRAALWIAQNKPAL